MRDADEILRQGLRALPVPEPSPDFDARVLAGLREARPWWSRLWEPAKPLLAGASFSLVVTLAGLHWTLTAPEAAPPAYAVPTVAARPVPSLDALLDRPNLSAASLSVYWAARPPDSTPPDARPTPRRRAQLLRRAPLIV